MQKSIEFIYLFKSYLPKTATKYGQYAA